MREALPYQDLNRFQAAQFPWPIEVATFDMVVGTWFLFDILHKPYMVSAFPIALFWGKD
jgi:hypothetical protein